MIKKRTITLSDEEWDALDRLAASKGMTRHAMFRRWGQNALKRDLPPVPSAQKRG